tara:strand:- start:2513 stop:3115 length:603 start_codon:yes stop_codon:yes gene_type:complete
VAKRFTDTTKWNEDWFLSLSTIEKLFWIYICDNCNHAGIYKPNKKMFEFLVSEKINTDKFLLNVNSDKERILILPNSRWYIKGFIEFQYGTRLNPSSKVHNSVLKLLNENNIKSGQGILEGTKIVARPRTILEVTDYFQEKGSNKKEGERFYYYYESQGWKVGKNPMKNWKMSASGWISRNKKELPDSDYLDSQIKAMRG